MGYKKIPYTSKNKNRKSNKLIIRTEIFLQSAKGHRAMKAARSIYLSIYGL